MRRPALYSSSPRAAQSAADLPAADAAGDMAPAAPAAPARRWQPGRRSFALLLLASAGLIGGTLFYGQRHGGLSLTQKDIDAAVLRTLQTNTLPSAAAKAAEIIRPSVVRVVGYGPEKATPEAKTEKRGRIWPRASHPRHPSRRAKWSAASAPAWSSSTRA